jgi:hypothetical protein
MLRQAQHAVCSALPTGRSLRTPSLSRGTPILIHIDKGAIRMDGSPQKKRSTPEQAVAGRSRVLVWRERASQLGVLVAMTVTPLIIRYASNRNADWRPRRSRLRVWAGGTGL